MFDRVVTIDIRQMELECLSIFSPLLLTVDILPGLYTDVAYISRAETYDWAILSM